MSTTVAGVYRKGRVELLEIPEGLREGRVRVTLEEDAAVELAPRYLVRGKYSGPRMSTEEDFKIAEWHGEPEFDDD